MNDDSKFNKIYRQEMDHLLKKLTKQKISEALNNNTTARKITINKATFPIKIKKLEYVKAQAKSPDTKPITNYYSENNKQTETEINQTLTTNNYYMTGNFNTNPTISNTSSSVKDVSEIVSVILNIIKLNQKLNVLSDNNKQNEQDNQRKVALKSLISLIKSNKNKNVILINEVFLENTFNLIENYTLRYQKYKILETEIQPHQTFILEELLLNDENNPFKIKEIKWDELITVYEILIMILNSEWDKIKSHLKKELLSKFFLNLKSLDSEERFILKLIFHKIYGISLPHRTFIISLIEKMLIDINYGSNSIQDAVSVSELLDLLKAIISGLSKPIKPHILNLITRNIFPLIKSSYLKLFSLNLKNFLKFLINSDKSFTESLIKFMIRSWPARYPDKLSFYIEIIEIIISNSVEKESKVNLDKILKKVALLINDSNYLIADKVLILFRDEKTVNLFLSLKIDQILLKSLIENLKSHWSKDIQILSKLVISKIYSLDKRIFDKLDDEMKKIIDKNSISTNVSDEIWDLLKFNLKAD